MQRLANDLIRLVWAVKVAGIDVIHPAGHGFSKDRHRGLRVLWRPKCMRACELHGAVSEPIDGTITQNKCAHEPNSSFVARNLGAVRLNDNGSQSIRVVRE